MKRNASMMYDTLCVLDLRPSDDTRYITYCSTVVVHEYMAPWHMMRMRSVVQSAWYMVCTVDVDGSSNKNDDASKYTRRKNAGRSSLAAHNGIMIC